MSTPGLGTLTEGVSSLVAANNPEGRSLAILLEGAAGCWRVPLPNKLEGASLD